jgi:hypothetical protein
MDSSACVVREFRHLASSRSMNIEIIEEDIAASTQRLIGRLPPNANNRPHMLYDVRRVRADTL